jgi:hypothetical protein
MGENPTSSYIQSKYGQLSFSALVINMYFTANELVIYIDSKASQNGLSIAGR